MMFATLDYEGCCEKSKTEKIATEWAAMLRTSGMDVNTYVIEADQVLFSTNAGLHANEIQDYVLQQKECVAVTFNSNRRSGPADSAEWKAKDAASKAEKEAKKKEKDDAEAAVKRYEEQRKRKKKAEKKRRRKEKEEV